MNVIYYLIWEAVSVVHIHTHPSNWNMGLFCLIYWNYNINSIDYNTCFLAGCDLGDEGLSFLAKSLVDNQVILWFLSVSHLIWLNFYIISCFFIGFHVSYICETTSFSFFMSRLQLGSKKEQYLFKIYFYYLTSCTYINSSLGHDIAILVFELLC